MEAEDVAFGILEGGDPAHALAYFLLGQDDGAACGFDFLARVFNGVDADVVHERLAGILACHQAAIDAYFAVFARLDEEVAHVPGVADLPAEGLFVELFGALHVVGGDFEMNNCI